MLKEYNKVINGLDYLNAVKCFSEMNSYLNLLESQIYRRSYIQYLYKN